MPISCITPLFMPAFRLSPQISTLRRQGRTLFSTVPETAEKEAHSLFVQEVKLIHTWTKACFVHSLSLHLGLSLNLSVVTKALLYPFSWSTATFSLLSPKHRCFTSVQILQLLSHPEDPSSSYVQPLIQPRIHSDLFTTYG